MLAAIAAESSISPSCAVVFAAMWANHIPVPPCFDYCLFTSLFGGKEVDDLYKRVEMIEVYQKLYLSFNELFSIIILKLRYKFFQ